MAHQHNEPGRILLFVRRVMPDASEEELIDASDCVREYAAFVIRLHQRLKRGREAAIRANETDSVDSAVSPDAT